MNDSAIDIREFHWLMDMLQTIDIGLVVIDRNFQVKVWNSFMENHSGVSGHIVKDNSLFASFPDIDEEWLRHKANSVFMLHCRSFMTWEQRPYLFKFKNYRPITGTEEFMYQNVTISPLMSTTGEVEYAAIIIYDVTDIAAGKKALENANKELEALSRTDRLTQLNNRGYWEECLQREFHRFKRYDSPCSVVIFDIDHFKKVNDTYGHQAGDEVIKLVSSILRKNLRQTDTAGRYGGEEFGVILTDTNAKSSVVFCERLRKQIEVAEVQHDGHTIKVTVSLGISEIPPDQEDYKQWLECADQALYRCKENGRNQTQIYSAPQ